MNPNQVQAPSQLDQRSQAQRTLRQQRQAAKYVDLEPNEINFIMELSKYIVERGNYLSHLGYIERWQKDNPDTSIDIIIESNRMAYKEYTGILKKIEVYVKKDKDLYKRFKEIIDGR